MPRFLAPRAQRRPAITFQAALKAFQSGPSSARSKLSSNTEVMGGLAGRGAASPGRGRIGGVVVWTGFDGCAPPASIVEGPSGTQEERAMAASARRAARGEGRAVPGLTWACYQRVPETTSFSPHPALARPIRQA